MLTLFEPAGTQTLFFSSLSSQASATGGFGSQKAETMADTAVTLATANVQVVSSRMIGRLHTVGSMLTILFIVR